MKMATFEVGKPAPYYCKACEAVPLAGYCRMAGCPTGPESLTSEAFADCGTYECLDRLWCLQRKLCKRDAESC